MRLHGSVYLWRAEHLPHTSGNTVCPISSGSAGQRLPRELQPSSDAYAGRCLVRLFEEAIADPSAEAMEALHAATTAVAASMRANGLSPELAVFTLKELLGGHGGEGWFPSLAEESGSSPTRPTALIYEHLFAWWVESYYERRDVRTGSASIANATTTQARSPTRRT